MKKYHLIFITLTTLSLAQGCKWDSSDYDKYVTKDDDIIECDGVCYIDGFTKENCDSSIGDWIEKTCLSKDTGLPLTKDQCESIISSGNNSDVVWDNSTNKCIMSPEKCFHLDYQWINTYCKLHQDINTLDKCNKFKQDNSPDDSIMIEWQPHEITQIGDGEYTKKIDNQYICGSYDDISATNGTNLSSLIASNRIRYCDEYKEILDNHLCSKINDNIPSCFSVIYNNGSSIQRTAACTICGMNQVSCNVGKDEEKYQCVDIINDAEHCGSCNKACKEDEICINGGCTPSNTCTKIGQFICEFNDTPICIDSSGNDYCGATSCEDLGKECSDGFSCEAGECICKSGISSTETRLNTETGQNETIEICINPASSHNCGAHIKTDGSIDKGYDCLEGTHCEQFLDNEGNSNYRCNCDASWNISCFHTDDLGVDCIDSSRDNTWCGAANCEESSKNVCDADQECTKGICICKAPQIECEDTCFDPMNTETNTEPTRRQLSKKYCGSDSSCISGDNSCNSKEICKAGTCVCDNSQGYVACEDDCISPNNDKYCGAHLNGSSCEYTDCSALDRVCRYAAGVGYFCGCPDGYVMCDNKCINPEASKEHCGAKGECSDPDPNSVNFQGKHCTDSTPFCRKDTGSDADCVSNCLTDQVNCNGVCVDRETYHLNNTCTGCDANYCYTGERDSDGNITSFNYTLCLTDDDSNKLNSNNFCGGCNPDHADGKKCDGISYICGSSTGTFDCECDISKGLRGCDINGEMKCLNFEQLHLETCEACKDGWEDCDDDKSNGCELSFTTPTIDNCGGCGINCSDLVSNAYGVDCIVDATTHKPVCTYTGTCAEGFGDCNPNTLGKSDGCETEGLMSDVIHCGSCTNSCTKFGGCNNGSCCYANNRNEESEKIITCCPGYSLYLHTSSISCWFGDTYYGCYDEEGAKTLDTGITTCWKKVE